MDTSKPASPFATSKPKAHSESLQKFHTLEEYIVLELEDVAITSR